MTSLGFAGRIPSFRGSLPIEIDYLATATSTGLGVVDITITAAAVICDGVLTVMDNSHLSPAEVVAIKTDVAEKHRDLRERVTRQQEADERARDLDLDAQEDRLRKMDRMRREAENEDDEVGHG
jgi:hypothetical protein